MKDGVRCLIGNIILENDRLAGICRWVSGQSNDGYGSETDLLGTGPQRPLLGRKQS
jgi:hypothetical protein